MVAQKTTFGPAGRWSIVNSQRSRWPSARIAQGGNLGFLQSSTSLEGLISGTASVSGLLDPDGGTGAHGSVRIQLPVFDIEGSRYSCGVASTLWEARRQ